jgi:hypothetical protein
MAAIKRAFRIGVRYIVAAFLIVLMTQLLLALKIIGSSFFEQLAITFVSLIIAGLVLGIAYEPKK